mgnify:CR=1 FL=1
MKKLKQEYLDKIDEIVAKHKDEKGPNETYASRDSKRIRLYSF